jgi:hypothetical protein
MKTDLSPDIGKQWDEGYTTSIIPYMFSTVPIMQSTFYFDKIIIPLIMEAEKVSETLGFCPELKRLVAREDFIDFSSL